MTISRRNFMIASMASLGASSVTAQDQIFQDIELGARKDLYARLTRPGPLEAPKSPLYMKLGDQETPIWIYVSPNAQRAKLVIFSHGAIAEPQVYARLLEFLTTHGYCVVAPIHEDSVIHEGLRVQENPEGDFGFEEILSDADLWRKRAQECLIARNMFDVIANSVDVVIDASSPIIMGHSYGAFTAQMLLGADIESRNGPIRMSPSGWGGGILLSPQGAGVMGLSESSWANVTAPLMSVVASDETDLANQTAEDKVDAYYLTPPNYKHLCYLSQANTSIYSGQRARPGTREKYVFYDMRAAINLFLFTYAMRRSEGLEALYGDLFARRSFGYANLISR